MSNNTNNKEVFQVGEKVEHKSNKLFISKIEVRPSVVVYGLSRVRDNEFYRYAHGGELVRAGDKVIWNHE